MESWNDPRMDTDGRRVMQQRARELNRYAPLFGGTEAAPAATITRAARRQNALDAIPRLLRWLLRPAVQSLLVVGG